MGSMGGLLGTAGGAGGTGFTTQAGTNAGQINQAYGQNQQTFQQQQNLLNALQAQNGLGNQSQVYGQLQGIASGQGPNPAQAMLNQATGANVANQAALMAGQRGGSQNVGLLARQAAQQGANIQQQAAGQGATMQANQALGAIGQAGGMANQMAANQIGQTNANNQAAQNEQNILQGANTANNQVQGQLANTTLQGQQAVTGGLMQSAGSLLGMLAGGGQVQRFADGGAAFGPQSMFAQTLNTPIAAASQFDNTDTGAAALKKGASGPAKKSPTDPMAGATPMAPMAGGAADAGGISSLAPLALAAAGGGSVGDKLKSGGHVPGQAKVAGDSLKNDTVNAKLSPGEVVIPRSVMNSKDPVRGSAEFVRAIMAKKKVRG